MKEESPEMKAHPMRDRPVIGVAWPRRDYVAALERAGATLRELRPETDPLPDALDACDGLLLTGGPDVDPREYGDEHTHTSVDVDPARDAYELALARFAIDRDMPLFAICRGAQVLNVAAGGTLIQDLPSGQSSALAHAIEEPKTARAHEVSVAPNTCLAGACGQRGSGSPCSKTADCAAPLTCIGSVCQLAPLGAACTADNECSSGQCAEGVCCESDSCGPCRSCKLSGSVGFCQPVPAGSMHPACVATPASSCGRDGTCDGTGSCRFHPAGTQCAPATCSGKDRLKPRTCDGMGACHDNGSTDCTPFLCNTATSDCFRSCTGNEQCCCGNTCKGNNSCN